MAAESNYSQPAGPDAVGITALSDTAQAFAEIARRSQTRERTEAAETANAKGTPQFYKVGDRVLFFIPPTHEQAERAGRMAKHLLWWRAPAFSRSRM